MHGIYSYNCCYVAVTRFGEPERVSLTPWLENLGLSTLQTVVTLDSALRPHVLDAGDVPERDRPYTIGDPLAEAFYWSLDHLLARIRGSDAEVLGALYEPCCECRTDPSDPGFEFAGYDIMDRWVDCSLVLNCDQFRGVLDYSLLNSVGLFSTLEQATRAKGALLRDCPTYEHVMGCGIWAMWMPTASGNAVRSGWNQ